MQIKIKEIRLELGELFLILMLTCFMSKTVNNFFYNYLNCLLFISFHELSHLLLASIFGFFPNKIAIKVNGLMLEYKKDTIKGLKGLIIYLIGPLSNLVLATLFKNIKIIYEINIVLCITNLLPIKPLDGYNILKSISEIFFTKAIFLKVLYIIENVFKITISLLAIFIAIVYNNFSLIVLLAYVFLVNLKDEESTKHGYIRY